VDGNLLAGQASLGQDPVKAIGDELANPRRLGVSFAPDVRFNSKGSKVRSVSVGPNQTSRVEGLGEAALLGRAREPQCRDEVEVSVREERVDVFGRKDTEDVTLHLSQTEL